MHTTLASILFVIYIAPWIAENSRGRKKVLHLLGIPAFRYMMYYDVVLASRYNCYLVAGNWICMRGREAEHCCIGLHSSQSEGAKDTHDVYVLDLVVH